MMGIKKGKIIEGVGRCKLCISWRHASAKCHRDRQRIKERRWRGAVPNRRQRDCQAGNNKPRGKMEVAEHDQALG